MIGVATLLAGCGAWVMSAAGPAYQGPSALVVAPGGRTLCVANADARQVAWVALPGGSIVRRVDVPAPPSGLAFTPDGRRLIVTCAAARSTVLVLDAATGRALATIAAGHTAMSPALAPDGQTLYVCHRFDNDVAAIDLASGRIRRRIPMVREPLALAVSPDGATLAVANHLPLNRTDLVYQGDVTPMVTLVDVSSGRTTNIALLHGASSLRGLCITPDGKYVLVTHLLSNFEAVPFHVDGGWINVNVVSVLDLRRRKWLQTIGIDAYETGAGNPWGIACTPDGAKVCACLSGTQQLALIDTADLVDEGAKAMAPMMGVWPIYPSLSESRWQRVDLPGQGPRALALAGHRAYVGQYFSDSVAVVDLDAPAAHDASPAAHGYGYEEATVGRVTATLALGPPQPLTPQRQGEMLFHDARLCFQHWQSCASCHPDARSDALAWDLLNDGEGNPKNTKSLLWSHRTPPAMSEGVRMSAEDAVRSGIQHILFSEPREDDANAIDAYLKSLQPVPSPYLVDGQLRPAAQRGEALFHGSRADCAHCHPPPLYTDQKLHNVNTRGKLDHTDRFDTPTLVEAWRTAPYLHDGRYVTLEELLGAGRHGQPTNRKPLNKQEVRELVEFVKSL